MNDWTPRIIILALLAIVLGVPLAFEPAAATRPTHEDGSPAPRLVIYSPHNEQIRHEFGHAFNEWRKQNRFSPVEFDWRAGGGTTDIRKKILAEFAAKARIGQEADGIGADLFFGGGEYEHNLIARGFDIARDLDGGGIETTEHITIATPVNLPDGMLKTVFPDPTIGGEQLYHPDLYWVGAALSSFGIVYNRDVLSILELSEPVTWADMADPRYSHWIALADPGHSGSIAATYNAILRRKGWTEGWSTLRRVFANARYFTSSAGKVPVDVSAGEAGAGMCIDFYGRFQSGAIGGNRVGYVDPHHMTAITSDPITILRGAPNPEIANQFVIWLLSPDGQGLWQRRIGTPGGPMRFELRRLPVRRDMYNDQEMSLWADRVYPYEISRPFPDGMPDLYGTVKTIAHAIAIDVHDDLKAAWKALGECDDPSTRAMMLELFDKMPEPLILHWPDQDMADNWLAWLETHDHPRHDETAAVLKRFVKSVTGRWKDSDQELKDRLQWTLFFQGNYREIVALGKK